MNENIKTTDEEEGQYKIPFHELEKIYDSFIGKLDLDRKSTRLNSSHVSESRMPSSA